jgi:hypothetical protein
MANRRFQRHQSLEKEMKSIQLVISTDGSGDVSSIDGAGVASVSHSTNQYTITLEDSYSKLMGVSVIGGVAASFHVDSHDVVSAKTIVVEASATQASSDIFVVVDVKNSSVK